MIFHYPTDTTVLSQNIRSLGIIQIHFGSRIIMQVKHIATSIMVTSTCRIYQTGRIIFFSPFCNFRSLELPPCLIERNPCSDTWIRIQAIHNFFPFFTVTSLRNRRTLFFRTFKIFAVLPLRITITARHILPHNNSQLITMSIPTGRFHFNMFTYHIES